MLVDDIKTFTIWLATGTQGVAGLVIATAGIGRSPERTLSRA